MSMVGVAISPINDDLVPSPGCFHTLMDSNMNESSIMILLSMSGSMVPMRVLESDSIESVKLKIQSYKGFFLKNQRLVYRGRELARNDSLVRDYGVADGNVLHLVLKLSDLQVINVKTVSGKEFTLHIEKSRNVAYVKQKIAEKGKDLVETGEGNEILFEGEKLEDQKRIQEICNGNDGIVHLLVRKSAKFRARPVEKNYELSIAASDLKGGIQKKLTEKEYFLEPVVVNPKVELSNAIKDLIKGTFNGLDGGHYPTMASEGTGGAYFMKDLLGNKIVSVFKPMDEEPCAINNPRGLPVTINREGLKRGTIVGEGAHREVAAYILDHPSSGPRSYSNEEKGFANVPPTFLVKCFHKGFNYSEGIKFKVGSLQKFVENKGSCEDVGPSAFPVNEVHKISVLDMRLANADRHAGNILISKEGEGGSTVLIPIDHGYCLPESFEDCTFDWLYWPQSREPYSADTISYIKSLNAEEDIALLKFYGWDLSPRCARTLRVSTMLLKKGAERGLTPFVIGNLMCRETLNKESVIEEILNEAHDSVLPCTSEDTFLESVSQIMDRRLDEISKL